MSGSEVAPLSAALVHRRPFVVRDSAGSCSDFFIGCGLIALFSCQTTLDHGPQPTEGVKRVERMQNA
jgi:hypothetical protein